MNKKGKAISNHFPWADFDWGFRCFANKLLVENDNLIIIGAVIFLAEMVLN